VDGTQVASRLLELWRSGRVQACDAPQDSRRNSGRSPSGLLWSGKMATGSREGVALKTVDQAHHLVAVAGFQRLERRPAHQDCVRGEEEVQLHPWARGAEAAHDLRDAGHNLAVSELAGWVAPGAPLPDCQQGAGATPLVDGLACDPKDLADLVR